MGQGQSSSTQCDTGNVKLADNEFQLAIDSRAFEFHMLSGVKSLRVSELYLDGTWANQQHDVFTEEKPFENKYVRIQPGKQKEAHVTVLEPGVFYLYKTSRTSVNPILCSNGVNSSVLYINMVLRKQELKKGNFTSKEEDMILVTPESVLIINLPDDVTRPTLSFLAEKSFDPSLLAFASRPL